MPHPTVLVMVHPGSACGSAEMNLGRADARALRDELAYLCGAWEGPVIVIDGDLSDELPSYPHFKHALDTLVERNRAAGHLALRVYGEDSAEDNQQKAIATVLQQQAWQPHQVEFTVSGVWYEVDTEEGCVGSVIEVLRQAGFMAYVNPQVAAITADGELADEMDLMARTRPDHARLPAPPEPLGPAGASPRQRRSP